MRTICGHFTLEQQKLYWQGFLNISENVIYNPADLLGLFKLMGNALDALLERNL